MSVICQKCRRLIRINKIDFLTSSYYCIYCKTKFNLQKEKEIISVLPKYSKIKVIHFNNELIIKIPPSSKIKKTFSYLMVLIYILSNIYIKQELFLSSTVSIIILFLFLLIITGIFYFSINEELTIKLNQKSVIYKQYYSVKEKNMKDIINFSEIDEVPFWARSYSLKYYVEIFFKNNKHFKFGSHLTKEERKYIIDELKVMYFKLNNHTR